MEIENEQVLSYHDLWEIMIGEIPKPYTMSNYYTKKSKIALLILTFSLEDDSVHHFHNIKTTFDVWMKLKCLYETSNEIGILLLRNKLTSLKMESSYYKVART